MGSGFKRRTTDKNKNLPYLSHEFVIQNHGDIVTCVLMVFIVGLMFQITTPLASVFVTPKYNITDLEVKTQVALYTYGLQDLGLVFFYSLAAVVFHAVIQEYVLDKLIRKTRLSKTNTSKFNESGQLLAFYAISLVWLFNIFKDEGYFASLNFFYNGYPHVGLTLWTKLFFIIQMSYWVHFFPELYFQKVKKEEMSEKIAFASVNLFIVASIYVLNLQRVGLTLLAVEYLIQVLYLVSSFLSFFGKSKQAKLGFNLYNVVFLAGRLGSAALAVYVFWFGLSSSSVNRINFAEGNFNTSLTRLTVLAVAIGLQLYFVFDKFSRKLKRSDKSSSSSSSKKSVVSSKQQQNKKLASSETSADEANDEQQSDVSPPPSPQASPSAKVKAN